MEKLGVQTVCLWDAAIIEGGLTPYNVSCRVVLPVWSSLPSNLYCHHSSSDLSCIRARVFQESVHWASAIAAVPFLVILHNVIKYYFTMSSVTWSITAATVSLRRACNSPTESVPRTDSFMFWWVRQPSPCFATWQWVLWPSQAKHSFQCQLA